MNKAKKKKILKAAQPVFARHGFYSSKMGQIAKASGVGKGSLYLYFKNKETLYIEVIIDILSDTDRVLKYAIETEENFWDKIEYIIRNALEYFMDNSSAFLILIRGGHFKSMEPQARQVKELMEKRVKRLTEIFEQGKKEGYVGDDFSAARASLFCLNLVEGMILRILEGWEEYSSQSYRVVLKFLKKGLA